MSPSSPGRPAETEYAEYYGKYVGLVPDGSIVDILRAQQQSTTDLLSDIPQGRSGHRYAPDKWSIAGLVGHLIDTEWVFTGRALWFARGDAQHLPGMEQDEWAARANHDHRTLASLIAEYRSLRSAGIALFESFDTTILDRAGVASDCRFTVRAIAYIIAGHERHHIRVLRERYL